MASNMKVTTICCGRFHIFDQARELYKASMLNKLITDYPKNYTRKWGVPDKCVDSLLIRALYRGLTRKVLPRLSHESQSVIRRNIHQGFGMAASKRLPVDSDVFIGLSSYSLESIEKARALGQKVIIDHGSLHEKAEKEILEPEFSKFGFEISGNWAQQWLIDREDEEFRQADYVLAISELAKRTMIEHGVPKEKILTTGCGVNLEDFYPSQKSDATFRVIQCSGLVPRKGVHYLLQAFTELCLPQSEIWFIGGGLTEPYLVQMFKKHENKNIIIKGFHQQNKLQKLYSQGSVFVLPSLADGFGMVVLQAMACGLPVIVTDKVGASEVVEDGVTGFVIESGNVDALKEKIQYLYDHESKREEMGKAAAARVATSFSWEDYGSRLADALRYVNAH